MTYLEPETKYKSKYYKGWYIDSRGYKLIYKPSHPDCRPDGYIFEHRLVMENKLKRRLNKHEKVHHMNHLKLDNNPENLMLINQSDHMREHHPWTFNKNYKGGIN